MPVSAVPEATHAVGRPGNDMRYAGRHLLLAARTPEGPVRSGPRDPADEPFPVTVGLSAFDPTDGAVQVELGVLPASAMGAGHTPIVAEQRLSRQRARLLRSLPDDYRGGTTSSAKATMLSS